MTLKEFNDFGRVLDFTFDNAPVLGAPEPDDNYVTLLWNIHHKIPGADWTHIAITRIWMMSRTIILYM